MTRRVSESSAEQQPRANGYPAVIDGNQVYTWEEACRRLRWRKHSARQAKRLGLKTIRFGSRDYVLGRHVLDFLADLAEQQAEGRRWA